MADHKNDKPMSKETFFAAWEGYFKKLVDNVGTIGDRTTVEDLALLKQAYTPETLSAGYQSSAQEIAMTPEDFKRLSNIATHAACAAEQILATDSVWQRAVRTVVATTHTIETGTKVALTGLVRGDDAILPPLNFTAGRADATGRSHTAGPCR